MTFRSCDAARRLGPLTLLCTVLGLSIACGRSDSEVQGAIQSQLAKDPVTAPLKLSVDVAKGVVTLAGETKTGAEQARATEIARSTEGVSDVVNAMRINDGTLADAVRKALAADPVLAGVPIEVDSRNGYVRLISNDTNRDQRERAFAVASKVDGVKEVEDRMK